VTIGEVLLAVALHDRVYHLAALQHGWGTWDLHRVMFVGGEK
jgi:hypothetical protein